MKNLLPIVILACLTVVSFWLVRDLEKTLNPPPTDQTTREIATAYQVSGRYYAADNYLQYTLDSQIVREFSNAYGTQFSAVSMQAYDQYSLLLWRGHADNAFLTGDKNQLTLNNNVVLVKSPQSNDPMTITGEKIGYDAKQGLIGSDLPVTISNHTAKQNVGAFLLDIKTKTIGFNGGVSAHYQPLNEKISTVTNIGFTWYSYCCGKSSRKKLHNAY